MSIKDVEVVLSRAISDPKFADMLFADADKALAGFDLTSEEIENFKKISRSDFEALANASPEERKSFLLYAGNHNEGFQFE